MPAIQIGLVNVYSAVSPAGLEAPVVNKHVERSVQYVIVSMNAQNALMVSGVQYAKEDARTRRKTVFDVTSDSEFVLNACQMQKKARLRGNVNVK